MTMLKNTLTFLFILGVLLFSFGVVANAAEKKAELFLSCPSWNITSTISDFTSTNGTSYYIKFKGSYKGVITPSRFDFDAIVPIAQCSISKDTKEFDLRKNPAKVFGK